MFECVDAEYRVGWGSGWSSRRRRSKTNVGWEVKLDGFVEFECQ
jgi:hypothetical protein